MWRLGCHDARFRSTMSLVVGLDGPVAPEALRSRLERLCTAVPRLRDRVRESPLGMVPPAWEPDPSFSVDHHVAATPGPLWEVASSVVGGPFDEGRPPWRVVVASSQPAFLVLHLHHSYTDGLGGMRLLAELFDLDAAGRVEPPEARARPAPPPAAAVDALVRDVEEELRRVSGLWSRAVPWAARTIAAARSEPGRVLEALADLATAVQAHAGAAVGPSSPVLAPRSPGVRLAAIDLEMEAMRRAAHRLGGTVNDVFLAGLLGGLERYHAKHGSVTPSLRMGLPISARESDAEMRNQVFGAIVRGPLGTLDFDERVRLVHQIVLLGRHQPWAGLVEDVAAGAVRVPGAVQAVAAAMASLDVVASNVIGPPVPMWLAGVPVTSMTPVGPRSGSALNATLLSYRGTASIGLNLDPASVAEPEVLLDCLGAAFDEGLAERA